MGGGGGGCERLSEDGTLSKMSKAKKQKTDDDEASAAILKYIQAQNRPYSTLDVFTNLHQKYGKTQVTKVLAQLAENKEITAKTFGNPEAAREMDAKIAALKEDLIGLRSEVSAKEKALASLTNSQTNDGLQSTLESLTQEQNQKLQDRLDGLRNGSRKLTVADKQKADKQLEVFRKHWRVRKALFRDAWNTISETLDRKKAKDMLEDMGIETDEAAGVSFDKDPLDGLMEM
ncbi:putative tbp-1 interacting protein [Chytriomyces sp. MP71]|nr:putative tbp-1 interacting protein [Chytriomyces sp. MP71]